MSTSFGRCREWIWILFLEPREGLGWVSTLTPSSSPDALAAIQWEAPRANEAPHAMRTSGAIASASASL
jgi:hypothetical protein